MKFHRNRSIPDVVLVVPDPIPDNRGSFAKTFGNDEFFEEGLVHYYPQQNTSYNKYKGTLRGMHYQAPPYTEAKLVSCIKGLIYDVAIDLRLNSPTFTKWVGYYLGEKDNMAALYIPPGFAHGYITLSDDVLVFYQISVLYKKEAERGVAWDDNVFRIKWPIEPTIISSRDSNHSYFWEGIDLNKFEIN